ncbi:TetR/AcrR family transcriptional regulator [Actinoplanes missouriensis]|uniref:TetR/AcrR family transcriptional regulator n=1 Tax=Actinoplanes missouriensis TaxID=1866 RepID=UPI0033F05069
MAYRQTALTRKNASDKRDSLLRAARTVVSTGGFAAATVAAIAAEGQASVGSVYSYFDGRDRLLAEVFRSAAGHELDVVRQAAADHGQPATERLGALIRVFSGRALQGRRMAWALLFEPVSPAVEEERLIYRRAYTEIVEQIVRDGLNRGEFVAEDPVLAASAVMGAISEALVGSLRPSPDPVDPAVINIDDINPGVVNPSVINIDQINTGVINPGVIDGIQRFCFRALGASHDS